MSSYVNLPPFGCIKTVEEICIEKLPQTTRIIGRLIKRDVEAQQVLLASKGRQHSIVINTRLLEPFQAKVNSLYQVVGEVDFSQDQAQIVMTARTAICVEGTDLIAYYKALHIQREYLSNK